MNRTAAAWALTAGLVTSLAAVQGAAQGTPTPDQLVVALKQNLADGQKRIRQYEWIETTAISLDGEEKSRKQLRVYYGADGTLTKLPIDPPKPPAEPAGRGGRGGRGGRIVERVVENKVDDMQQYMERAVTLIQQYVPPDPTRIQTTKDAGRMQVRPLEQGLVRIEFLDFVQKSDQLGIVVDAKAALLSAVTVATYLDTPEDAVTLDVRFGTLADGTSYTSSTTLDSKAKNIRVVVENSGHRPLPR